LKRVSLLVRHVHMIYYLLTSIVSINLGNFYSIRNDHARAIQYFTRALRMNPDYPAAWILLGHEFVEGKNHAAAINAYREALGELFRKVN
jgi:tetratricopeptide (TPR) repeat protein